MSSVPARVVGVSGAGEEVRSITCAQTEEEARRYLFEDDLRIRGAEMSVLR